MINISTSYEDKFMVWLMIYVAKWEPLTNLFSVLNNDTVFSLANTYDLSCIIKYSYSSIYTEIKIKLLWNISGNDFDLVKSLWLFLLQLKSYSQAIS